MTATFAHRPETIDKPFLTAEWRYLSMANWQVDPAIVEPFVPRGTALDFFHDETFVSVVGFLFRDTRLLGMPIPFHRNFEEVNLRFYVRRVLDGESRRGVVFLKELVPRWAVKVIAHAVYNENYAAMPMRHDLRGFAKGQTGPHEVAYAWQAAGRWHSLHMNASGRAEPLAPGSHEEFIAEHYFGYCRQRDGGTIEYQVDHPPWHVWPNADMRYDCDVERFYGRDFAAALAEPPRSAFIADGSAVRVAKPKRIA